MSPTRKPPAVIVLTEEDLRAMFASVQEGFASINARIDALEEKLALAKPGLATAKLRQELAAAALKAAATQKPVRVVPRKRTAS